MSLPDYAFYYSLRRASREKVAEAMNDKVRAANSEIEWPRTTFCSITRKELDYARLEWPKYYSNSFNGLPYSWEKLWHRFSPKPSFFDLAIWQQFGDDRVLQALALGKPSNGKHHLTVNWVERTFAPSFWKLGGALPIAACAEEYAKLIGCERVLIKDPSDPQIWVQLGYQEYLHKDGHGYFLGKELSK